MLLCIKKYEFLYIHQARGSFKVTVFFFFSFYLDKLQEMGNKKTIQLKAKHCGHSCNLKKFLYLLRVEHKNVPKLLKLSGKQNREEKVSLGE